MKNFLNNMMKLVIVLLIATVALGATFYMLKLKDGVSNEKNAKIDGIKNKKQTGAKDKYIQSISLSLGNGNTVRNFNNSAFIVNNVKSNSGSKRTIVFTNKNLKYFNTVTGLRIKANNGYNLTIVQNPKFIEGKPNLVPLKEPINGKSKDGFLKIAGSFAYNNIVFDSGKMIYMGQLVVDNGKGVKDKIDLVIDGRTRKKS